MKTRLLSALVRWLVNALGLTCRYRLVAGAEHLRGWLDQGNPVVFSCWHNRIFFCADFLHRRVLRRGRPLVALVSQSRDGELGAQLASAWGTTVVRGSSSRGGSKALRQILRAVSRSGASTVAFPDGPRGPRYKAKAGAVMMAQICGIPILPIAFSPRRTWRLKSWDRIFIPKPFTRVAIAVGEPFHVPRHLTETEKEEWRRRLEAALNDCARLADGPKTDVPDRQLETTATVRGVSE